MDEAFPNKKEKIAEKIILKNLHKRGLTLENALEFSNTLAEYGIPINNTSFSSFLGYPHIKPFIRVFCKYDAISQDSAIPIEAVLENSNCYNQNIITYIQQDILRPTNDGYIFLNLKRIHMNSVIIISTIIGSFILLLFISNVMAPILSVILLVITLILFGILLKPYILYLYFQGKKRFKS